MVFSSLSFIFVFLPLFFAAYYFIPRNCRNLLLAVGSVAFYAVGTWGNPLPLILLFLFALVNGFIGYAEERFREKKKLFLILGLIYDFGTLAYFKYADFFLSGVNAIGGLFGAGAIPLLSPVLPLGISFYTFEGVSYLCDVYHGKCRAERSPVVFAAYLFSFPHLISGPILTYPAISDGLRRRRFTVAGIVEGLKLFIIGLGLKVLLANRIGGLFRQCVTIGFESISTPLAWMGIFAFSFQLYFDFFGYSVMAVGLGKMLGFRLPRNFEDPYMSLTMTEFWRRWHITLGSWFREYIYIPLGGNRKGTGRTYFNLLVVWLFTGIWHGAGLNYLLWGLLLFLLIAGEKRFYGKWLDAHPAVGHLYMFFVIPLSWVPFAISDAGKLAAFLGRLFSFGAGASGDFAGDYLKYGAQYGVWLLLCLLFSTGLPEKFRNRIRGSWLETILLIGIFWACAICLLKGMNDPFLYFGF